MNYRVIADCINSYVYANTWAGLVTAVRSSTRGSSTDEMIQLLHRSRASPTLRALRDVRTVIYDRLDDVPNLLIGVLPAIEPSGSAKTSYTTAVTKATDIAEPLIPQSSELPEVPQIEEDDAEAEVIEDLAEQAIPTVISGSLNEGNEILDPTEEEQQAAARIQAAYRRYSSHRVRPKGQLAESREKLFLACLKTAEQVELGWYRKMMLGPLPHVLAFLELLYTSTQELKYKTKKRMRLPLKHEELDALDQQLTQTRYVPSMLHATLECSVAFAYDVVRPSRGSRTYRKRSDPARISTSS